MVSQGDAAPKKATAKKPAAKQPERKRVTGEVDEDFEFDDSTRYTGECVFYNKSGGFGLIKLDEEGVVPENKIMMFWREITSDDRWPFLRKELKVEFNLNRIKRGTI